VPNVRAVCFANCTERSKAGNSTRAGKGKGVWIKGPREKGDSLNTTNGGRFPRCLSPMGVFERTLNPDASVQSQEGMNGLVAGEDLIRSKARRSAPRVHFFEGGSESG